MGRPLRVQYAGACYHITLQGNNRRELFFTHHDRRHFLRVLRLCRERYRLKVYAYALLSSDAHLLVETAQPNLSQFMQTFSTSYSKYFSQQHAISGHIFQGRYRAVLADRVEHLPPLTRLIHLAPVRAGFKGTPWQYPWSSAHSYVQGEAPPPGMEPLVDPGPTLEGLAGTLAQKRRTHLRLLEQERRNPPKAGLRIRRGVYLTSSGRPPSASSGPEGPPENENRAEAARRILKEVTTEHGMDEARLRGRSQWRELTTVRKAVMHRMWKEGGLGVTDISRIFNRTPSAVSQAIKSVELSEFSKN